MSRRAVLAGGLAAGAGLLTGCTAARPGRRASTPPDPDPPLQAAARSEETALLARYDATLLAHPELAGLIASIRGQHAAHLHALGPAPTPSAPRSAAGTAAPAPTDRAAAVRALVAAEAAAAARRADGCVSASSDLAPLLGSIAGSESSHAALLALAPGAS